MDNKMPSLHLFEKIQPNWQKLIAVAGLVYSPSTSNRYNCQLVNQHCILEVRVERYFNKFDVRVYDPLGKHYYPKSVFTLMEAVAGAKKKLAPYLLPTAAAFHHDRFFYQRFFLHQPPAFGEAFGLLQEIILTELRPLLFGDFTLFDQSTEHFRNRPQYPALTDADQLLYAQDYEQFERAPFSLPEEKVRREVNQLVAQQASTPDHFTITSAEQAWIDSLQRLPTPTLPPLSGAYLTAFEAVHSFTIPRPYKLLLNYFGNGFYRCRSLEQSLCNNESTVTTECFEFIDTSLPFVLNEETQSHSDTGFLRLYEYGCGIVFYLIVQGEHYGKIWCRNPEYGEIIERYPEYCSFTEGFQRFLEEVVQ